MWGSQYDAMMNWMQKNGENVASSNSNKTSITRVTGGYSFDVIKNIFDLYGCHADCTLEANSNNYRTTRGSDSYNYFPSNRVDDIPVYINENTSTRPTLYIK